MICGIVDLGSNSIRMSIYNYENGMTRMLLNKKTTAGLSGYVVEKELTERGIRKACQVLGNYKNILTDFGIGNAYIFATASLRNIANTEEAVKRIEDEMGLYVDVLSGEEEARLGFMGATLAVNIEKGLFIDIGGGSTELVTFRKREILKATSMPVGSLNLFLRHTAASCPPTAA